ncbi:hypothetical protein VTJ49DRAFT_2607 [Mycothermus thermophilus]|uniref:Uncharacterized protein n=1 Tax=Humicola insolens TaxID=85995 RepID=A0ABR3V9I9_HUMIN
MRLSSFSYLLLIPGAVAWNHIKASELQERLQRGERTLVAYIHHQPQDKPSQLLEPIWTSLQSQPPVDETAIVSIECSLSLPDCLQADVASYPAIRLLLLPPSSQTTTPNATSNKPKQHRYRGPRTASSILAFLRRMTRQSSSGLPTPVTTENMTTFASTADDVVFLGRFGPSKGKEKATGLSGLLRKEYESAARRYRDRYTFGIMTVPTSGSTVTCQNNVEGVHLSLSAAEISRPGAVDEFVRRCAEEVIPALTRRNELSFYETGKSIVHFFPPTPDARAAYLAEMRPLAQKYAEYLHFVTTDPREFPGAAEMLGLSRSQGGLSVQNPNTGDVYPYRRREKISAASVEAFLGDIIQGNVHAWKPGEGHDEL